MELNIEQWHQILLQGLGLRSCSLDEAFIEFGPVPGSGHASYSMSYPPSVKDVINPLCLWKSIPVGWKPALINTLDLILGFPNAGERILCIITGSRGSAYDYPGCFCKSSSEYTRITNSYCLEGKTKGDKEELADWVISNIPPYPML